MCLAMWIVENVYFKVIFLVYHRMTSFCFYFSINPKPSWQYPVIKKTSYAINATKLNPVLFFYNIFCSVCLLQFPVCLHFFFHIASNLSNIYIYFPTLRFKLIFLKVGLQANTKKRNSKFSKAPLRIVWLLSQTSTG